MSLLLHYFILLSKASMIQMTKAASALGLGKSSFVQYLECLRNCIHGLIKDMTQFFILTYDLNLSMRMLQVCFT